MLVSGECIIMKLCREFLWRLISIRALLELDSRVSFHMIKMGSEVTCFTNSIISRPLTVLISVLLFSFIYHNGQKNCEKCSTSEPRVTPKASYCIGIRSAKLLILRKESVLHNKKNLLLTIQVSVLTNLTRLPITHRLLKRLGCSLFLRRRISISAPGWTSFYRSFRLRPLGRLAFTSTSNSYHSHEVPGVFCQSWD